MGPSPLCNRRAYCAGRTVAGRWLRRRAESLPATDGYFLMHGFDFDTVGPVLPPGTQVSVGKGADMYATFFIDPEQLWARGGMKPFGYKGVPLQFKVNGTLAQPKIGGSTLLLGFAGAIGGNVLKLTGGVVGATGDVVSGGVDAVGSVGKGALNMTKSLGLGLFDTVKGAATLDADAMGSGLKAATVGTVGSAATGVKELAVMSPEASRTAPPLATPTKPGTAPPPNVTSKPAKPTKPTSPRRRIHHPRPRLRQAQRRRKKATTEKQNRKPKQCSQ